MSAEPIQESSTLLRLEKAAPHLYVACKELEPMARQMVKDYSSDLASGCQNAAQAMKPWVFVLSAIGQAEG